MQAQTMTSICSGKFFTNYTLHFVAMPSIQRQNHICENLARNWQFDMAICIDRAGKRSTSGSTFVQGPVSDQVSTGPFGRP